MQMSFFDFEEFNELKAEAKKKETPRKTKYGLQAAPYVKERCW